MIVHTAAWCIWACLATIFLPVWLFGPCLLSLVLQNTKLSERRKFPSHSRCVLLLRPAFVVRRFPGYSRECTRVATSIWLSVSYGPTFLVSHLRSKTPNSFIYKHYHHSCLKKDEKKITLDKQLRRKNQIVNSG